LIEWVEKEKKEFSERDFGDSLARAQEVQARLRDFVVSQKPLQEGEKMDLENLFAEIQTQLTVNNRRPYVPPEGLAPEDLEAAFDALSGVQKSYAQAVRKNRYRFIQKLETKLSDEKLAEMKASFNHFDKNKNGALEKLEFKAALSAMSIFFTSDSDFDRTYQNVTQGNPNITMEQYLAYLTSKYQDKDSPDQIKESFKAVADGGANLSEQHLAAPYFSDQDAEFLAKALRQNEDGSYDYASFVDSQFSS